MAELPPSPPAPVPAPEERARLLLSQGKWRKARDEIKPLVKADRVRYLPLLIEANLGLAREMIAKGLISEAQQVAAYLATIAPAEQVRSLKLQLAMRTGAAGSSLSDFLSALSAPDHGFPEAERWRVADLLVLAFTPLSGIDPGAARLAAELQAIQDALEAVSMAQWEKVSDCLRTVSHRSPVSHWAGFVKGLAAFHTGEIDKAERFLRPLPPGTVPAKAGEACLLLVGRRGSSGAAAPVSESVFKAACQLSGSPGLGATLWRAETLWKQGKPVESYRACRDALPSFPCVGTNGLSAVSQFYFQAPHRASGEVAVAFLRYFDGMIATGGIRSSTEEMLIRRLFALTGRDAAPAARLRGDWERFLQLYEALHGHHPRLASLACGWLGQQLARVPARPMFFRTAEKVRDKAGALEMLHRSIELDPGNLQAHLDLCQLYTTLKQLRDRNVWLDLMAARFPRDKQVLLQAAAGCLERQAFKKGLDYLFLARSLDQLDPRIPDLIVTAQRRLARRQFEQGRPERGRREVAALDPWLTDKPEDLQRSRWTARLRHGLMELIWGDEAQAATLLAQGHALAPSPAASQLFAHLAHRVYVGNMNGASPFLKDFKKTLRAAPGLALVPLLLDLLQYWRQAPESPVLDSEEIIVCEGIKAALRLPFTRAEALAVVERAQEHPGFGFADAIETVVRKVLQDDPLDPHFRFLRFEFNEDWEYDPERSRAELQKILDEAVRRRDEATTRRVREMLKTLAQPPNFPDPMDVFEPEDDDEEDGWEEAEDDGMPAFPSDMPPEFAKTIELLRSVPEEAMLELRKSLPRDMPVEVFDALVRMARMMGPKAKPAPARPPPRPSAPPAPPVRPPKAPAPSVDPNQMNLF